MSGLGWSNLKKKNGGFDHVLLKNWYTDTWRDFLREEEEF